MVKIAVCPLYLTVTSFEPTVLKSTGSIVISFVTFSPALPEAFTVSTLNPLLAISVSLMVYTLFVGTDTILIPFT